MDGGRVRIVNGTFQETVEGEGDHEGFQGDTSTRSSDVDFNYEQELEPTPGLTLARCHLAPDFG